MDIRNTFVTELNEISSAKKLIDLYIGGTKIQSLKPLATLKDLTFLEIDDTSIEEQEISDLRKALPYLKIVRRGR
ncbi:MAG: hypothetical protein IPO06_26005 [Leptospiraceae bacterium]|nr:hypothetical protein [Leptospiraceae bacterium]